MSRTASAPATSRDRLRFMTALIIWLAIVVAAIAYFAGWFGRGSGTGAVEGALTFITEEGQGSTEGTVNSPLTVVVRFPTQEPQPDTIPISVTLQLLDEAGRPAEFGGHERSGGEEAAAMRPGLEMGSWQYDGSVPSRPGTYRAQVQYRLLRLTTELQTPDPQPRTIDFATPVLIAKEESGPPLRSGYVFARMSNLWLLSTDVARQRRLTFYPPENEFAAKPAWSPDGKSIAFVYSGPIGMVEFPETSIWTINPDGSGARELVAHGDDEALNDPAWSNDGRYLYFTVQRAVAASATYDASGAPVGERHIERFDVSSGERTQLLPSAHMPAAGQANGDVVLLEDVAPKDPGGFSRQRLVRASADGSSKETLVDENSFQMMTAPRPSPDGKWVAFSAINNPEQGSRPGQPLSLQSRLPLLLGWLLKPGVAYANGVPWDLYIVPWAGGQPLRVTNLEEDQPYSTWLDSSTLALIGERGLYRVQIDGSGRPVGEASRIHEGSLHSGLTWHGP